VSDQLSHHPASVGADRPELLTVQQAAECLNVSVRNIRHQVHQRRLPIVKIGRLVRIERGELEAFIERCRVDSAHPSIVGSSSEECQW
jgi:excisionase family DNA binding protein